MQKLIDHLPEGKQVELYKIVDIIRKTAKVDIIILFGSFARGAWVEDRYFEDYVMYEYKSDFDILVIVNNLSSDKIIDLSHKIEVAINHETTITTHVSIIVDNIYFINEQLKLGRYFYSDIKKEGIVLYDSKKYKLATPKKLSRTAKRKLAKEDYEKWFPKALQALKIFSFCLKETSKAKKLLIAETNTSFPEYNESTTLNWGAFHIHQAIESFLIVILLVYTGYRPKTHNIAKLLELAANIDKSFKDVFPVDTIKKKKIFNLLKKAYVDARYDKNYSIKREELEYLEERTKQLKELVEKFCEKEIR